MAVMKIDCLAKKSILPIITTFLLLGIVNPNTLQAIATHSQPDSLVPGRVIQKVKSTYDSSQEYAVYLPSDYSDKKQWPVVMVMDPRGRALMALDLFREGAEKLGYILLSSYNTMSDGPEEPNVKALNAMINDAFEQFSSNQKRVYLAGFSGTTRLSWPYGYQLDPYVAGLIGFGAGPAPTFFFSITIPQKGIAFSYYGGSGYYDFNYFELLQFEKSLAQTNFPYVHNFYEGPHRWAPKEICTDALYWMELRAMTEGLRTKDQAFIDHYKADLMKQAEQLEEKNKLYEAYRLYDRIRRSFASLADISRAEERMKDLERSRTVKRTIETLEEGVERYQGFKKEFFNYLKIYRTANPVPDVDEIINVLNIRDLLEEASDSTHPYRARTARVILENIYVRASFYETRDLLKKEDPRRTIPLLEVADLIKPNNPRNCFQYARVYAQMEAFDKSMDALKCLQEKGILSLQFIETDPYLKNLSAYGPFIELKKMLESERE